MIDLRSARLVATVAPEQWFGGYDRNAGLKELSNLERALGCTFYRFDVAPFFEGNETAQWQAVEDLRAFAPQAALGLPNAGYPLLCRVRVGHRRVNVFTEVLGIPTILPWDHAILQFPSLILGPLPDVPEYSAEGAILRVRVQLDHPLYHHLALDSGHVSEMRRIGLLTSENVTFVPTQVYKPYIDHGLGLDGKRSFDNDLMFAGNVYLSRSANIFPEGSLAGQCASAVVNGRRADPTAAAWRLLASHVEAMSGDCREAAHLGYDHTYFWNVAYKVVEDIANTHSRIEVLRALKSPVSFYGGFSDPESMPRLCELLPHVRYRGSVDFADDLPGVYARSRILVDAVNAGFIDNTSPKGPCCFAAGGFALFEYKADFARCFGDIAEHVMYRSLDDLNGKIDYFLTHEQERIELSNHFRTLLIKEHDFYSVCGRALLRVLDAQA